MKNTNWITHLIELRRRLLWSLLSFVVLFLVLIPFADKLYSWLAIPLLKHLPQGSHLIATALPATFLAPLKLSMVVAFILSLPIVSYQIWSFIAPGLYQHERRAIWPLSVLSFSLFLLGMLFAYTIVFPLCFRFFIHLAPSAVTVMPDMTFYLNFALKILLAFGLAFQVPVITLLLIATGVTDRQRLAQLRPYVIVFAFILGMLLTPPDVLSQVLLALPIWGLFECGLVLARVFKISNILTKYTLH